MRYHLRNSKTGESEDYPDAELEVRPTNGVMLWRCIRDAGYCGKVWHRDLSQKVKSFSILLLYISNPQEYGYHDTMKIFLQG